MLKMNRMSKETVMIDRKRRAFIKGALGIGATSFAIGTGLISLSATAAPDTSDWPEEAFNMDKGDTDAVIESLYGKTATESDKIKLDMPTIAQNGNVVPFTLEADLPEVTSMALLVPNNPNPLIAKFKLPEGT